MSREKAIASILWQEGGLQKLCRKYTYQTLPLLFDGDDLDEYPIDVEEVLKVYARELLAQEVAAACRSENMPMRITTTTSSPVSRSFPFFLVIQYRHNGTKDDALDLDAWQGKNAKYTHRRTERIPVLEAISKKWRIIATFQCEEHGQAYVKLFRTMEKRLSDDTGKGPTYAYTRTDYMSVDTNGDIQAGGVVSTSCSRQAVKWLTTELFKGGAPHYSSIADSLSLTLTRIVPDFINEYRKSPVLDVESAVQPGTMFTEIANGIQCKLLFDQFGDRVPDHFKSIESRQDLNAVMLILRKAVQYFYSYECPSDEDSYGRSSSEAVSSSSSEAESSSNDDA